MKKVLLVAAIAMASSAAMANEENGFYLGAALGKASYDVSKTDVNGGYDAPTSVDDSDSSLSFIAGYTFNKYFSLELSHNDLGTVGGSVGEYYDADNNYNMKVSAETEGLGLAAKLSLPVSDSFSLYTKLGYLDWKVDYKGSYSETYLGDDYSESDSDSEDGKDFFYTVGAQYDFGKVAATLDYAKYDVADSDVKVISLGVAYQF